MKNLTRGLGFALWLLAAAGCAQASPTNQPNTPSNETLPSDQATTPSVTATPEGLPTLTPVRTPPVEGLYVDPSLEQGAISPYVYGTNYGPWLSVPLQMQEEALALPITVIRFPGGNWGDLNEIHDYQLDQFMYFAEQMGADVTINVRLRDGTAEKAAELVHMVNIENEYGVKYWAIGNEPNLFPDGYTVERFNQEWREWAVAMREVDPTIQLIGPEVSQFFANPTHEFGLEIEDWVVEFLKANGDMVDIVSFHRYPFPASRTSGSPAPEELLASTREWDDLIRAMRAYVREHSGRDLPIAVTEVNSSWLGTIGGDTTLESHLNAIWWGDSLGRMIRQGTFMVNQFAIVGDYGLMGRTEVYPIYRVYQMYERFGTTLVYAASSDADVSIFAARREDGTLTLMIVNLSLSAVEQTLTLEGGTLNASEVWLFDETHPAESVSPDTIIEGNTLRLSPASMTLIVIAP